MNSALAIEASDHLRRVIIPFWKRLKDEVNGGYFGRVDFELTCLKKSAKGIVQTCRIIYFFSEAAIAFKDEELAAYADHAYRFLLSYGFDEMHGGLYWSLAYDGMVEDSTKSSFCFAYGILALTSYWRLRGDEQALQQALQLYELTEEHFGDAIGYKEVLSQDFSSDPNTAGLFAKDSFGGEKMMNTPLHLLDAYRALYQATGRPEVLKKMERIIGLFVTHIFDPTDNSLIIYFDRDMKRANTYRSYGHEIEASWMLASSVELLKESEHTPTILKICDILAHQVYQDAYRDGSVMDETHDEAVRSRRGHWIQAEAVLGFMAAYERNPESEYYRQAAETIWTFIQEYLVDKRPQGEWLYRVDASGKVTEPYAVVWPWKGPYNNGRMCLHLMKESLPL
ncbi:MAG: AGE family epimerase/isomerase [Sphaerochaeta sp.]|jgi:mannobiose 2-epimerase|nr:hypothetical protein [Spirochaetales bacterium]